VNTMKLGLLGGGQLGRMFATQASNFGYQVVTYCPELKPVAAVVAEHQCAHYNDRTALKKFAAQVGAVTIEFENVPVAAIELLSEHTIVRPGATALESSQNRLAEKRFLTSKVGVAVAPWHSLEQSSDLEQITTAHYPAILKTAAEGYDGKGQVAVKRAQDLPKAWQQLNQCPAVLEQKIQFEHELSVILVRNKLGQHAVYGPFRNEHKRHILNISWADDSFTPVLQAEAKDIAISIGDALKYEGVLCIEFFQQGDRLIVNEIAPRPHNSGHLTIEAFSCSQFEQQLRVLTDAPIGPVYQYCPAAMINIISEQPTYAQQVSLLAMPGLHWHWYGKCARPGRKLGHLTITANSVDQLRSRVTAAQACLTTAQGD